MRCGVSFATAARRVGMVSHYGLVLACCAVSFLPALCHAQTTTWTNTSGGLWNTSGNWSAGVPVAAGTAQFQTVTGNYTVITDVNPTITNLAANDGTVTLNLAGHTFTASGTATI